MKVNNPRTKQGSFGIPPHLKASHEKALKDKEEAEERGERMEKFNETIQQNSAPPVEDDDFDAGEAPSRAEADPEVEVEHEEAITKKSIDDNANPIKSLEKIGVTLESEDFHKLVFKGHIEKEVEVVPEIMGNKPLIATFKLLTVGEYDMVDELLGEDIKMLEMTRDGFDTRRSTWIITMAVTKLNGKPVCKPIIGKDKKVNWKATYRKKREIIALLSPTVMTKMIHIHGIFTMSANAIVSNPEADFLKKS